MPSTVAATTAAAAALTTLVTLTGLAMVYLGAHRPTDVLAGRAVRIAVGAGVVRLGGVIAAAAARPTPPPAA